MKASAILIVIALMGCNSVHKNTEAAPTASAAPSAMAAPTYNALPWGAYTLYDTTSGRAVNVSIEQAEWGLAKGSLTLDAELSKLVLRGLREDGLHGTLPVYDVAPKQVAGAIKSGAYVLATDNEEADRQRLLVRKRDIQEDPAATGASEAIACTLHIGQCPTTPGMSMKQAREAVEKAHPGHSQEWWTVWGNALDKGVAAIKQAAPTYAAASTPPPSDVIQHVVVEVKKDPFERSRIFDPQVRCTTKPDGLGGLSTVCQ